jgi:hypothetical protein
MICSDGHARHPVPPFRRIVSGATIGGAHLPSGCPSQARLSAHRTHAPPQVRLTSALLAATDSPAGVAGGPVWRPGRAICAEPGALS